MTARFDRYRVTTIGNRRDRR